MQIRPLVQLRFGRINEPVRIPMNPLLVDATKTYLSADVNANEFNVTVQNITGFADNQYVLIGEVGNENSEIAKINGSPSAPSTITFDSGLTYAHTAGTYIYVLKFNRVEISIAPTVGGVKVVLTTIDLIADNDSTDYNDTVSVAGYYYARYFNSETSVFSPYSDPAPYSGYTLYSARSIIDKALNGINKTTSNVLTDEFAFQEIDNCQMECLREYKRWSFMQEFNHIVGLSTENQVRVALPSDVDDQDTTKSIWHARISRYPDMDWVDKEEWDALMQTIAYSTLANAIALSDATITLVSSGDFTSTGAVKIGANVYNFSANNKTTGVLTLSTPSTTTNIAGTDVTEYGSPGLPQFFTVWGGYMYFFPQIAPEFANFNIYFDYYKKQTVIQHDSDNIVLPDATVVQYFLQWKFLLKLNNGEENVSIIAAQKLYTDRRDTMKKKEWINRKFILKPYDLG